MTSLFYAGFETVISAVEGSWLFSDKGGKEDQNILGFERDTFYGLFLKASNVNGKYYVTVPGKVKIALKECAILHSENLPSHYSGIIREKMDNLRLLTVRQAFSSDLVP